MAGKRSSDDDLWQEVKGIVRKRDGSCVLTKCLTVGEAKRVKVGPRMNLDCAHVLSASSRPDLVYEPSNVHLIGREFHRRLDDYQDPVTGIPVGVNEHFWWWWRILNRSTEKYDPEVDYQEKVVLRVTNSQV